MAFKLRPIEIEEAETAAALLSEGFASHEEIQWRQLLERLFAHARGLGETAVGQLVAARGEDVGLCLVIPSFRRAYVDPPERIANIASFYLRPGHEWMAPLIMRRIMAAPDRQYIDLTASHTMREINRKIGFQDHSRGVVIVPLPIAAFYPGGGAGILPLDALSDDAMCEDHRDLLVQHARLGCMAFGLAHGGQCHPMILVPSRRKGIPGARVVLARDRALIRTGLGPIARMLLKLRLAFLEFEAMSGQGFPESPFWTVASPYQTNCKTAPVAIDHTFSELVFLHPGLPGRVTSGTQVTNEESI